MAHGAGTAVGLKVDVNVIGFQGKYTVIGFFDFLGPVWPRGHFDRFNHLDFEGLGNILHFDIPPNLFLPSSLNKAITVPKEKPGNAAASGFRVTRTYMILVHYRQIGVSFWDFSSPIVTNNYTYRKVGATN
jgi:hypothetical protein